MDKLRNVLNGNEDGGEDGLVTSVSLVNNWTVILSMYSSSYHFCSNQKLHLLCSGMRHAKFLNAYKHRNVSLLGVVETCILECPQMLLCFRAWGCRNSSV